MVPDLYPYGSCTLMTGIQLILTALVAIKYLTKEFSDKYIPEVYHSNLNILDMPPYHYQAYETMD